MTSAVINPMAIFPSVRRRAPRSVAAPVFLGLALLFSVLTARPALAQTGEGIRSFGADITVQPDGRIKVVETIDYQFPSPKHGIYRDIPTRYVDDQNNAYIIPLTVAGVGDGRGGSWPYQLQDQGSALRLKIGDPNRTISGSQTYVIDYAAEGALRYFSDHDELYWNATGSAWTVPIDRAAATVRLPDNVPADQITVKCYTGAAGSKAENCQKNVQGRVAEFAANGPLTVVVGWPHGLVAELQPKKIGWLDLYWPLLLMGLPFLIPVLVFLFLFWRWWKKGRDLKGSPTLVVQYDPPPGLTPADVGALWDEQPGTREITATIVDLAVRGYLKISETEKAGALFKSKDFTFQKLKEYNDDQTLQPYERSILDTLFSGGGTAAMSALTASYAFQKSLSGIQTAMSGRTVDLGFFESDPAKLRGAYIGVGIVIIFIGFFLMVLLPTALLTGLIIIFFGWLMPRRTPAGVAALDHAKGFKEYLSTAEKYRLQWQEKENIFETFLPYAMVFGVVDKWAKTFEGLTLPQPKWYEGTAFQAGAFNAVAFHSTFSTFSSSMSSAVSAAPARSGSGSGFGGGGFSGGGGGGGGGGSW